MTHEDFDDPRSHRQRSYGLARIPAWLRNAPIRGPVEVAGGISSAEEEAELRAISAWVTKRGFAEGVIALDHSDEQTGDQIAIFDLAWPNGLQEELSQPVAVLLNEDEHTIALASAAGYRCFTSAAALKTYVNNEILGDLAA